MFIVFKKILKKLKITLDFNKWIIYSLELLGPIGITCHMEASKATLKDHEYEDK